MKCIVLGCGGSNGVPEVDCACYVCASGDHLNKRSRSSIYIETQSGIRVLVDTSPDLHMQALRHGFSKIDAVIYTHAHYDHIGGIGDLKKLVHDDPSITVRSAAIASSANHDTVANHDINAHAMGGLSTKSKACNWYQSHYFQKQSIKDVPAFMDSTTESIVTACFPFAFRHSSDGLYKPLLRSVVFAGPFSFADLEITPFWQRHGKSFSYGFRFGNLAYSTDVNGFTDESITTLQGVKVWIIDCTRYFHAPTHLSLEPMLNAVAKVNPERVILTHMGHEIEYHEFKKILPLRIEPGYDGMVILC